jgi:hypothetical protein
MNCWTRRFLCGLLVLKESRRLVLPRTSDYNSGFRKSVAFHPGRVRTEMAQLSKLLLEAEDTFVTVICVFGKLIQITRVYMRIYSELL